VADPQGVLNGNGAWTAADGRVLVLAATAKDAELANAVLTSAGLPACVCETFDVFTHEVAVGAAVALIAEEGLTSDRTARLARQLAAQPPWSDLPILVLARPGADSAELGEAVRALGNVTLLERPLRVATLLSAMRTAIRARERQYQIRGQFVERARTEALLRQSDQRKDEFLATLGHELRNPLAPLTTGIQLLKANAQHDRGVIAVMERQVGHLTRLVDDLLEVSRVTRGVIEVRREPTDLGFVVQSAIETSRPAIALAGHHLDVELPEESITVHGDAVRLTQIFANLLSNAVKYTNFGGRISLRMRREDDRAVVSVRDTGIGIPPGHLDAIFDMFTQVDRSNRRSQGGLGIGLTLVRSLVAMHDGTVEARSEGPGLGSEFIVRLPAVAAVGAEEQRPAPVAGLPARRVLVVDDNVDAADTLGLLLRRLGATVFVCHSGLEALDALDTFQPDAVVLDIGMPGMDGYEVARRLRATPDHGDVLLIALTGWGQAQDQRRSRAARFDHHLIKPPDLHALRHILWEGWVPPGDEGSAPGSDWADSA
jgi:signal transduction histidine kinase/ActR/RegA family two-component response regulator